MPRPALLVALCALATLSLAATACESEECPAGDDMVALTAPALGIDFMMDRYEASRFDASASSEGSGSEIACSIAGVQPWREISYRRAKAACSEAGKHLCTRDEWLAACRSLGANHPYPYGPSYALGTCNGDNDTSDPEATGSRAACVSIQGAFDLSGNVREWVTAGDGGEAGLAGGAYADSEINLLCSNIIVPPGGASKYTPGPGDGFRCCK